MLTVWYVPGYTHLTHEASLSCDVQLLTTITTTLLVKLIGQIRVWEISLQVSVNGTIKDIEGIAVSHIILSE